VSRLTDVDVHAPQHVAAPLPAVDWSAVGASAPVPVGGGSTDPSAPLPAADVAVLTWTSAEWEALDHVFVDSGQTGVRPSYELATEWQLYSRDAPAGAAMSPLWGYYRVVEVGSVRVLLFKCDAHLAHAPWISGLETVVKQILADAKPSWIYSIGTAGGSREDLRLGDTVLTDAAHIELKLAGNTPSGIGGETFTGTSFPSVARLGDAGKLAFPLSEVVTDAALAAMVDALHQKSSASSPFGVADLVNAALSPASLGAPRALDMHGTPLLTTDYYYIASGADDAQWAVLEMDDAVIAYVAQRASVPFVFVRNVSDPLVPVTAANGDPIPAEVREDWSALVYAGFGLYTSFNGALATWAAIAG
jgi:nucleoside phosphorylase